MTKISHVCAALLSIGDELLLGEIIDTNKPWIAQSLLPLGIRAISAETVGDEVPEIVDSFRRAIEKADIVIATGGLGPTDDDLTMEALAKALGIGLEFRAEVMEQMAARLNRSIESLPGSNRKQAMLPAGSIVLRNDWGTAPGVHFRTGTGKHIFLMPGVPREMKGLLKERIIPILQSHFSSSEHIIIKSVHTFGIPESVVGERIKPFMQAGQNPNVGTRIGGGIVTVRLVAHGANVEDARRVLEPALTHVRASLQDGVFGEDGDTLAFSAMKILLVGKRTVATAESCTGGKIASYLTDIPGSSAAFLEGVVVYSNEAKVRECGVSPEILSQHGAVSAQTASALATGIRTRTGADIGISVTGIAGPGGGTPEKPVGLVYFGVATASGVTSHMRNYPGLDRHTVRDRASVQALDLLRRAAIYDIERTAG